jgi:putative SOS response-associated peptidase YedK
MCGRFTLTASGDELAEAFDLDEAQSLEPRYNIAPSQEVVAVVAGPDGRCRSGMLRWGFVSSHLAGRRPLINARAESVGQRSPFAAAFARRRCLLPADGFYEWQTVPGEKRKRPHYFRLSAGGLFGLAAIWEPAAEGPSTCAILTTEPNAVVSAIHDRMPVIVPRGRYTTWLDPARSRADLLPLLGPFTEEGMTATPVGLAVNDARHESPACIRSSP